MRLGDGSSESGDQFVNFSKCTLVLIDNTVGNQVQTSHTHTNLPTQKTLLCSAQWGTQGD